MIDVDFSYTPESLIKIKNELIEPSWNALTALKDKTCRGSEWTGWYDFPKTTGLGLAKDIKAYVKNLDIDYDIIVVIGIGGSYLGTRAVYDALSSDYHLALNKRGKSQVPMIFAGQHLSESSLNDLLEILQERSPIVNVISKTGTTTEPSVAFRFILNQLEKKYAPKELAKRVVLTTDGAKGALRQLGKANGYKMFSVPNDVGGRYSVLSAVGLLPLCLAGFDIDELNAGAADFFGNLNKSEHTHPVLEYAAVRMAAYRSGKVIEVLALDEPKVRSFGGWWQQLFGESEGKESKGIFPTTLTYTTDLHSLGQYVQEGLRNLFETFLSFKPAAEGLVVPKAKDNLDELEYLAGKRLFAVNQAATLGTKLAHYDGGVPCIEINAGLLNERSLGELFSFFETACAVSSALLGVNPFDQPGVEAYKTNLFALLEKPGFSEQTAKIRRRLEQ